ncbi:MAG: replication factor C small subunit [Candidatus Nanoarchaeia archaeon]|nr:replication factor C small subunit [Candidatus Nanoarchaeia archaeon]
MEIWTEKYRPHSLNDIVGQKEIIQRIKSFVSSKSMPHLLFAGPAGIGKTTTSLAIARDLFGENWKNCFLEINASDESGIPVIRGKVKDFARTRTLKDIPFKIILLDEADALTSSAQHALRRTMEKYASTCRFILDCNYSSKIIDPIQSRCAVFRFKPLTKEDVIEYLNKIYKTEFPGIYNHNFSSPVVNTIAELVNGDVRKAVNLFQSVCASHMELVKQGKLDNFTPELVYEVASYANPADIKKLIETALKGNLKSSMNSVMSIIYNYGLSGVDLLKQMQSVIIDYEGIEDVKKLEMIDKIAECEFRLVEGADPYIQIQALLAQFMLK